MDKKMDMIDIWKGIGTALAIILAIGIFWTVMLFVGKIWGHINERPKEMIIRFDSKGNLSSITTEIEQRVTIQRENKEEK